MILRLDLYLSGDLFKWILEKSFIEILILFNNYIIIILKNKFIIYIFVKVPILTMN